MNIPISRSITHRHSKTATVRPVLPEPETRCSAIPREELKKRDFFVVEDPKGVRICAEARALGLFARERTVFSCLHELATNRVSNQARGRIYVKLAHSGRSMRLRRFYAEIQDRADGSITVALRNQFNDRLLSGRKYLARVALSGQHTL